MAMIEDAATRVADAARALADRFCGTDDQEARLIRARLMIDEAHSRIVRAPDADAAVGATLTASVAALAEDIDAVPADGGAPFDAVIHRITAVFGQVMQRLG